MISWGLKNGPIPVQISGYVTYDESFVSSSKFSGFFYEKTRWPMVDQIVCYCTVQFAHIGAA